MSTPESSPVTSAPHEDAAAKQAALTQTVGTPPAAAGVPWWKRLLGMR